MQHGALAMIDALGFKGIWTRHDSVAVMRKLKSLPPIAQATLDGVAAGLERHRDSHPGVPLVVPRASFTFLSDTIVVAAWIENAPAHLEERQKFMDVLWCAYATSAIMAMAATPPAPSLVYRGCISYGQFFVDAPFILGPAVDEAAENMDAADAGITWLTPSARSIVLPERAQYAASNKGGPLFRYSVPMKGGGTFDTFAVTPFSEAATDVAVLNEIRGNMLSVFSSSRLDIQIKKQNTERFLDAAWQHRDLGKAGDSA